MGMGDELGRVLQQAMAARGPQPPVQERVPSLRERRIFRPRRRSMRDQVQVFRAYKEQEP